jgi:ABC-type nickel/cobalt efflux system permease component RcnA
MFVAVIAQTAFGALRVLAIHIPLGVAIVAFALGLAVWSFRPAARRTRSSRVPITRQEVRR